MRRSTALEKVMESQCGWSQSVQGSYIRLKREASSTSTWLRTLHTIFRKSAFVLRAIGNHGVDLSK